MRPPRRQVLPSASWGPDVPELVPRMPLDRYMVVRSPSRKGDTEYGWVLLPANYRVVSPVGSPVVLNARDEVIGGLVGDLVEWHLDLQEARTACRRYGSVQGTLDS